MGGGGNPGLSSLHITFNMGTAGGGANAGAIWIEEEHALEDLASPKFLRYGVVRDDIEIIRVQVGDDDILRQVKSPSVLADIITIDDYTYEIRFYDKNNWGQKSTTSPYWYENMQTPFVVWKVENPDGGSAYNRLQISKIVGTNVEAKYEYVYTETTSPVTETWTLYMGDWSTGTPKRIESRSKTEYEDGAYWLETYEVQEDDELVYQAVNRYDLFNWGYELTQSTIGTGNPMTITQGFYTSTSETGKLGKYKWWTNTDGSWVVRDYDSEGRITKEISAWNDVSRPNDATVNIARTVIKSYTPIPNQGDDGNVEFNKPRTVTEYVNGTAVAKTYYVYYTDGNENKVVIEKRCAAPGNGYDATDNLTTTTVYEPENKDGIPFERIKQITYPDERYDIYSTEKGTYTENENPALPGSFTQSSVGLDVRTTVEHYGSDDVKYTKDVMITDAAGREYLRELYTCPADERVQWTVQRYNDQGQLRYVYNSNNESKENVWSDCCGLEAVVDSTGIRTEYLYDELGRIEYEIKKAVGGQEGDIVTTHTYEGTEDGLKISRTVTGGALSLTSYTLYDTAGRVATLGGTDGLDTTMGYSYSGGEQTVTRTLPGEATEITAYYLDAKVKSITGDAVVNKYYDFGVDTSVNQQYKQEYTAASDSTMVVKTYTDALGRIAKVENPGWGSGKKVVNTYTYNNSGQLASVAVTDESSTRLAPTTYFAYDALGRMYRFGQDMDATAGLQPGSSTDRITDNTTKYYKDGGDNWWLLTFTQVYAGNNDTPTPATPDEGDLPTGSYKLKRLTGFATGQIAETKECDLHGNVTTTSVAVNTNSHEVTTTVDFPDSSQNENQVVFDGRIKSQTSKSNLQTTYAYDDLGRPYTVTDPRDHVIQYTYYTNADAAGSQGKVKYVDEGVSGNYRRTTYTYYGDTHASAGRAASIQNPAGNDQYYDYNERGQETKFWGDVPYPVKYVYDAYGLKTDMYTYQGGTAWAESTWPASEPDASRTSWVYDVGSGSNGSGLLKEKKYLADSSQQIWHTTIYTYKTDGKLYTRVWERDGTTSVTTTYAYDANTFDLSGVSYSDSTPAVTFSYNRLGQQYQITDAVGTRTFGYSANTLQLATETIDGSSGGLYSKTITRDYEDGGGSTLAGRAAGFHIGSEYETDYSYDTYGRLDHVTGPGLTSNGVYYGRYASTDMVQYVSYDSISAPLAQTRRDYEGQTGGYRNVLLWVENKVGASTVSKYDYSKGDGVDSLGRRTSVVHEGSAFGADHHWSFEYNGRNELDKAERFAGDDPDAPDEQYTNNGDFIFAYDNIGNRATYRLDDEENPTAYTRNPLNQYTDTSYPTESFSYDRDGNMTADGTYVYTWDGENRLIGVAPASSPVNGDKKLEFKYDYMGRRVEKIYSLHNGSTWVEQTHERFVYDEWNVIMVLNGNSDPVNQTLRRYTWGLDMSGLAGIGTSSGLHGAGGISGLIAGEEMSGTHQGSYWYFYDGNGNVGQILKYEAGSPPTISTAACYEYDPYGNVIGPDPDNDGDWQEHATEYAKANPIRFSTKWFDESGLGYWGYRYYSPRLGRWINRDPIGEDGGINLYLSIGNCLTCLIDNDGRETVWSFCKHVLKCSPKILWCESLSGACIAAAPLGFKACADVCVASVGLGCIGCINAVVAGTIVACKEAYDAWVDAHAKGCV